MVSMPSLLTTQWLLGTCFLGNSLDLPASLRPSCWSPISRDAVAPSHCREHWHPRAQSSVDGDQRANQNDSSFAGWVGFTVGNFM